MITRIDHVVLTVRSVDATCAFYEACLGFERVDDRHGGPTALRFGRQKFNLHQADNTFDPKAIHPTPGSADFCLITTHPIEDVVARVEASGAAIEVGPVARRGALGPMTSIYFRDPDGNLVEVSRYPDETEAAST
jgi:catechol 2,3-dioxygenase-like lactoylglutathione lyase family enzyme